MTVTIKVDGGVFDRTTLDNALKSLGQRDFVSNDGEDLVYAGGRYKITMSGAIAAPAGEEPRDWGLNNTAITEMTLTAGSQKITISGLFMNLREIFPARAIDELRDWNDFSPYQDYRIIGSGTDDVIRSSLRGNNDVEGRGGDDRLVSRGRKDELHGGAGDDVLVARGDHVKLWGDAGSDRFVIRHMDTDARIMDFEPGRDYLGFGSVLDKLARGNRHMDDRLKFIGDDDFGHGRYEIRTDIRHAKGETFTVVEVSIRGHEHQLIEIKGAVHLDWNDFLL